MKLDNRYLLETAEGIDIMLTPAGLGARTMAFVIDMLIRTAIYIVAAIILSFTGQFGLGILFIVYFFLEWLYPVVFEIYNGATPGKKTYGLIVVYDNGLPVTLPGSMLRNLFRTIDILPFGYLAGMVCMLFSVKFQRIGDYVAGTMVVYKEPPAELNQLNVEDAPVQNISMTLEEQKAIVAFAERGKQLSLERKIELAEQLEDIIGCKGEEAVNTLNSIASRLVGKS
ncbi:RDD family protein [Alteromonadaceae bacterium M269]|nr:RDD family protein [Alteromonadaceae bacterium M269]